MIDKIEYRGWKEICELLGVKTIITARKILLRNGLLTHDGNKPVLNIIAYTKVSLRRHLDQK